MRSATVRHADPADGFATAEASFFGVSGEAPAVSGYCGHVSQRSGSLVGATRACIDAAAAASASRSARGGDADRLRGRGRRRGADACTDGRAHAGDGVGDRAGHARRPWGTRPRNTVPPRCRTEPPRGALFVRDSPPRRRGSDERGLRRGRPRADDPLGCGGGEAPSGRDRAARGEGLRQLLLRSPAHVGGRNHGRERGPGAHV